MSTQESLKARMTRGEPAIGCWLMLTAPAVAEIVAQSGYDTVMIDLEHGPGGPADAVRLMQAVAAHGTAAMMRVPANDPVWLKRALDTGIEGVMIPAVSTPEQAEAAVAGCRYPPKGHRGLAATVVRATGYGARWQDYVREIDDRLTVICQIEAPEAIDNVEAIAAVEGVDMLFVGPFDLSAQMGYLGQPDHPDVRAAIERAEKAAKAAGKLLGGIATPERGPADLVKAGYDLVIPDADVALLRMTAEEKIRAFRTATKG